MTSKAPEAKLSRRLLRDDFAVAVECLTNHERNLWARACYPGLRGRELTQVNVFLGPAWQRRMTLWRAKP